MKCEREVVTTNPIPQTTIQNIVAILSLTFDERDHPFSPLPACALKYSKARLLP